MTTDPIVDEIKRFREAQAAQFIFDLRAIVEDARRRQETGGRRVVRRPPRIPQVQSANDGSSS